ncbi:MAG TPA: ATP synthase subunit I [Blastocatellia bacterium]|nr:ATP synthase subunit I [Blastocatellia bacterium]
MESAIQAASEPAAVQRRVWRNLAIVGVGAVAAAFAFAELRFALGIALGVVLALFNFWWLQTSVLGALTTGTGKTPSGTILKFVVRWIVVGIAAYAAYATGYFDPIGIILGLTIPAAAVIVEAGYMGVRAGRRN